jgi:hypothetical protein
MSMSVNNSRKLPDYPGPPRFRNGQEGFVDEKRYRAEQARLANGEGPSQPPRYSEVVPPPPPPPYPTPQSLRSYYDENVKKAENFMKAPRVRPYTQQSIVNYFKEKVRRKG